MNNLGFFDKVIFFVNSIFAILLLASYLLPYIPPHIFPALSVLSLVLPVLIVINAIFLVYWIFRGRRQLLLSGIILAIGITHIFSMFRLGGSSETNTIQNLKVLTYNVRQFNVNGWSEEVRVGERVLSLVQEQQPDIVSFQEYHPSVTLDEKKYPYQHKVFAKGSSTFGQVIFSKFPIVSNGSLDFEKSSNNAIYADIATLTDTIRIYNVHFQSFSLSPDLNSLQKQDSKRLLGRLGQAFKKQEQQVQKFLASEKNSLYPVIVTGDFNNSSTSYMYRKVKGGKNDAFAKAGSGTGATFWFDFIPLRIDFILAEEKFPVVAFETFDTSLSDHKPSMATLKLK